MWASPIARSSCSPVVDRSTRAVGSSSSIRWRAAPILSRSAFVCGSIATDRDGSGKSIGGRMTGFSRADSVSPVSVAASLATAPISPAWSSPIGSWSLPCRSSSWPIRSSSSRFGVPGVGLAVERAAQDPEIRQPADERVRRRLERPGDERPVRVRGDRDRVALRVLRLDRRLLGRGRHVADERVEQGVHPDALRRAADEDRREDRVADAPVEAGVELGVADLLAVEVLRHHVVVGLGRRLEQLVAAARDLVGELVGDRDLDLLAAVERDTPCGGRGRRSR